MAFPTAAPVFYPHSYVPVYEPSYPTPAPVAYSTGIYAPDLLPILPFPQSNGGVANGLSPTRGNDFLQQRWPIGLRCFRPMGQRLTGNAAKGNHEVDKTLPCQFYLRTGTCAFEEKCRYYHPPNVKPPVLNSLGYPLRRGAKQCSYYMKHAACAFGATCKFHHPELHGASKRTALQPQMMPLLPEYANWVGQYTPQGWYPSTVMPPPLPNYVHMVPPTPCSVVPFAKERMMNMSPVGSYETGSVFSQIPSIGIDDDTASSCGITVEC